MKRNFLSYTKNERTGLLSFLPTTNVMEESNSYRNKLILTTTAITLGVALGFSYMFSSESEKKIEKPQKKIELLRTNYPYNIAKSPYTIQSNFSYKPNKLEKRLD